MTLNRRTAETRRPLFALAHGLTLVLASASPRRRQFLEEWGIPFQLACPADAEPRPEPGEDPTRYTCRAATAKAHAAARALADGPAFAPPARPTETVSRCIILAADTVVAVDGHILGKPHDERHAMEMLTRLSGRGHEVISAVCLLLPLDASSPHAASVPPDAPPFPGHGSQTVFSDVSRVFFHPWSEAVLRAYARTGEPDDKAGAYAIQGQGAFLVERVEGSWSTVVGLPVTPLARTLLRAGFMLPATI